MRRFTAGSVLSQAAALLVLLLTSDATAAYAACLLFGLSAGNLLTLPALVIQREFAAAAFGMLVGLSWAISQFTYAFGPGVLGVMRDVTGSYNTALAFCIALEVAAAGLILIRPRRAG
jgi:cyanate permease